MSEPTPDIELVESLAKLLKEQNLGEIEFTRRYGKLDDVRVRVSAYNQTRRNVVSSPSVPLQVATDNDASDSTEAQSTISDLANLPGAVTAPMVGTIYLQSEPEAPPFIEVGQIIAEGDTLFIIEAMKTMNHIPAPHAGTVRRILVENSSIVEFGSPLAIID